LSLEFFAMSSLYRPLLILFLSSGFQFAFGVAAQHPNIILIYSDDHGWADLGAQGVDKDIRTPNLDQLTHEGIRFPRGYVSAPQCLPSRAGVITGRYQQRFGVEDNNKGPLPLAEITIAERLKPAGYVSCQVGKWHMEKSGREDGGKERNNPADRAFLPMNQGFDEYFTGTLNTFVASHDLEEHKLENAPTLTDPRFRCLWQTDAALSFIGRHTGDPFFLYLAYFTPHVPLAAPEPWYSQTPKNLPKERREALSMIAAMDDGIGRLRAKLKESGIDKTTLIFFIGDNGAPIRQGAWNGSLNLPLIGEKGMLTDGGIRTPFIAAWPGTLPAGQVYEHPVSSLDVAATAASLASLPHDAALDGVDLMPFLTGANKAPPHETLYWRWRTQAAVLEFPWKLIRLGPKERYLFDVTTPEGELHNLIVEHADIATRLEAKLKTWSDELQPPGLPNSSNEQDNAFFAQHINHTGGNVTKAPRKLKGKEAAAAGATIQGWLARNGTLSVKDGALVLTPETRARVRPFLTHSGIELIGPVTATMRARTPKGGSGSFAWRVKGQNDFIAENIVTFDWPASADWQEVKVTLPVSGTLIHLRLSPPKEDHDPAMQSIELRGQDGKVEKWAFDSPERKKD
jgi:uncharacterized sulfatase